MIAIQLVDETTFEAVCDLTLAPKDERRVGSPLYSLAQTWLYRDSRDLLPYAILASGKVVGFALLHKDQAQNERFLWRLLIDQAEQNKGYGKEALRQIIQLARQDVHCHTIRTSYVMGNHRMRGLLETFSFQTKGPSGNEVQMVLSLN